MILVTGGTGLVGAHLLLHLLQKGESIRAIYRSAAQLQKTKCLFEENNSAQLFEKIDWVIADITDIPALEIAYKNIDFVYHCAAKISFDRRDEELLRKVNIEGTANMVNCALAFKIKKFCYVSSVAALGDVLSEEKIITEETDWNPEKPHSDYALSKYGAELEIWRAYQEGLAVIIVNPGVILGSGFWESGSGEIFKKVATGISFYTRGNTGFVDVSDLTTIMYALMKSPIVGERYTIIAENSTYKEILTWISEGLERKKPKYYASPWMTSLAWRLDALRATLFFQKRKFTRPIAKSLHSTTLYSNEKIKKVLDFDFSSIEKSCKEIAQSYSKVINS